jgi:CheY-like chemotaxis protein
MDATVVFADDDQLVRACLTEVMRNIGLAVHPCSDGAEAVRLCEEVRPDVVLLDLDMPVMNGFEAAQRIRDRGCSQRLVALTGRDIQEARRSVGSVCFDHFLSKPITAHALIRALVPQGATRLKY